MTVSYRSVNHSRQQDKKINLEQITRPYQVSEVKCRVVEVEALMAGLCIGNHEKMSPVQRWNRCRSVMYGRSKKGLVKNAKLTS